MMTFFGCATGVLNPLKRMTDMAPKDPTRSGMWVLGSIRYLVGKGVSSVAVPNGKCVFLLEMASQNPQKWWFPNAYRRVPVYSWGLGLDLCSLCFAASSSPRRRVVVANSLIRCHWAVHSHCDTILTFKVWKVEEVSHEMLVLASSSCRRRVVVASSSPTR